MQAHHRPAARRRLGEHWPGSVLSRFRRRGRKSHHLPYIAPSLTARRAFLPNCAILSCCARVNRVQAVA
eukprot:790212-Pleurochrysis_carterae.AAC.2